ncbi:hypothetical protein SLEP1_g41666 [Rubroshorea leprosula]|uniref:Uncharacterized protein n=1 Tax=Rubroshorea leprosula TaxID=152421 RepID=A0AAV5L7B9_9ROSI|nr:hypothetical protein SLEP1_g41666 [Rubroshorea leprosula]
MVENGIDARLGLGKSDGFGDFEVVVDGVSLRWNVVVEERIVDLRRVLDLGRLAMAERGRSRRKRKRGRKVEAMDAG